MVTCEIGIPSDDMFRTLKWLPVNKCIHDHDTVLLTYKAQHNFTFTLLIYSVVNICMHM